QNGHLRDGIVPITVRETYLNEQGAAEQWGAPDSREAHSIATREYVVDTDEGPRADTSLEALARLKPVFAEGGSVTAGNSSQTSDGAAFVLVVSERKLRELNVDPIARLVS